MQLIGSFCLNAFMFAAASLRTVTRRAGARPCQSGDVTYLRKAKPKNGSTLPRSAGYKRTAEANVS